MQPVLYVLGAVGAPARRRWQRRLCGKTAADHGYAARFIVSRYGSADWRERLVTRVRAAVVDGERLVVALGGDGTISACAQGVADSAATLAIVPCGTANIFARSLGIPFGFGAALRTAFGGVDRTVDAAVAGDSLVLTIASIGLDAAVIRATARTSKRLFGWLGYGLTTLPHLRDAPHRYRVQLDDRPSTTVIAQTIAVANAAAFPAGLSLSPDARPDDGLLEVALLNPAGIAGWVMLAHEMLQHRGRGAPRGRLAVAQARTVRITADIELPRQLDGDPLIASHELRVHVAPGALTVRVPSGAVWAGRGVGASQPEHTFH